MNAQTVFIVDKERNTLIYLEILDDTIKFNKKELGEILGEITSKIIELNHNNFSEIEIFQTSYLIGNFEKTLIILQYEKKPPPKELLEEIRDEFLKKFSKILENYSEGEISQFKSFTENLMIIIKKFNIFFRDINKLGYLPLIEPVERETYFEGLNDYERDEILWKEAKLIKDKFSTNFREGLIFELEVFLNISPNHIYKIIINFSNFPQRPIIKISDELKNDLGKELEKLVFFIKNWDEKRPAHIIEVIKELEFILKIYHHQDKLSETKKLSKSAIPVINPLPDIKLFEKKE